MRDNNLLISDSSIAASAFATNAIQLNKTPVDGVWLMLKVTKGGADADERLDVTVYAKDEDSAWATTDEPVAVFEQVGSGMAQNESVVVYRKVQTNKAYIKPRWVVSGTSTDWDVELAVATGPAREVGAG
jgi:hypothetical protein